MKINNLKPNTYYKWTNASSSSFGGMYYTTTNGVYFVSPTTEMERSIVFDLLSLQKALDQGYLFEIPYMNTALYKLLFKVPYENKT